MIKTPNFVLFVSFVVNTFFASSVAALPRWVLRGGYPSTEELKISPLFFGGLPFFGGGQGGGFSGIRMAAHAFIVPAVK